MTNFRNITLLLALFLCTVASATAANQDVLNLTSLRSFRGDGHGGEGFTIPPVLRNEKPATLIIVHGLGGTGEEWGIISLALSFFSLNYVKFVIPTAPIAYVTYLKRNLTSWFDITSFEQGSTTGFEQRSVEQLSKAVQINPNQFEVSVQRMNRIIQREIANGVEPERIFLTGFSQGGAIALHTFLRSKWSLAGVIGAATWIPFIETYPAAMSRQTSNKKILLLHVRSLAIYMLFSHLLAFYLLLTIFSTVPRVSTSMCRRVKAISESLLGLPSD